jgi:hypothetical protein
MPQIAFFAVVAAMLAGPVAERWSSRETGRMGVSLSMQSGQVQFQAHVGTGRFALEF